LYSGLLALALLLLACCWLLATGEDDTLSSSEAREAATVTRYFVTNALSFIVGWACVLVVVDLQPHVVARDDRPHQLETLGIFLLFGPALTYGPTAWSKGPWLARSSRGGLPPLQKAPPTLWLRAPSGPERSSRRKQAALSRAL